MHGKIHPHWFLPMNYFPCQYYIRAYSANFTENWFVKYETESSTVVDDDGNEIPMVVPVEPDKYHNINSNELIALQFNAKTKQFKLIEKVYTTNNSSNENEFIYHRENIIKCYYPEDFTEVKKVKPGQYIDGSNIGDLIYVATTDDGAAWTSNFYYGTKEYIGRRFRHYVDVNKTVITGYDAEGRPITTTVRITYTKPFIVYLDPHKFAEEHLDLTNQDYDFALVKYTEWSSWPNAKHPVSGRHKAIISKRNYYPYGWFEPYREYWTLLKRKPKEDNEDGYERICMMARTGKDTSYGLAISEIIYYKLNTNE